MLIDVFQNLLERFLGFRKDGYISHFSICNSWILKIR